MTSNLELFPAKRKKTGAAIEWVGGRFILRYEIEGVYPAVVVWMELPSRKVVGFEVRKPVEMEGWFAESLRRAMKKPLAGKPRRPAHVRVADAALAGELREEHHDIEIVVAPTPELDALIESMAADVGALHIAEDSRLPPKLVCELFGAAERFYRLAPWTFVHDAIRVDIASLEIEANCVWMIGRKGKDRGFLLFPSIEGLDAFMRAGAEPEFIGTHLLSLTFEKKADVPPDALRAIEEHGWPLADDGAYPNAALHDETCAPMRLDAQDVRMLVACTNALVAFCAMHRDALASDEESISESFTGNDDLTVRLTYPFDDADLYEDEPPAWDIEPVRKAPTPGRNDPCHCGSGKKYKKCHLDADQKAASGPEGVHAVDRTLLSEMVDLAAARFGPKWLPKELKRLPPDEALMLVFQWAAYELPIEGQPLVEHFLAGTNLTAEESAWIAAQRRAWLGIWEVLSVTAGKEVVVRDLLTGQQRTVTEREASRTLRARDAVLARVVDHEGASYFCGMYARSLPPFDAAEVVRSVRATLRAKTGDVPVERLRGKSAGRLMIMRWARALDDLEERFSRRPELSNTDGEALAFVIDRFSFDGANRKTVEGRLAAIKGASESEAGDDATVIGLLRGKTIIAQLFVTDGTLRVETNSEQRATAVRRTIEEACGDLIRHRSREQKDPLQSMDDGEPPEAAPEPAEEEQRLLREFKQQHYRKWLDEPIPLLGGKTPRQAARSRAGRKDLDLLLRHIEHGEAAQPEGSRFDVSALRSELGL